MNTTLEYQIVTVESQKMVFLPEPGFFLDALDVYMWATDKRDDDPDLYATLVSIFIQLKR